MAMEEKNKVEEPIAIYQTAILQGDMYSIISNLKKGLSFKSFLNFVKNSPFNISEWASLLHISERTMQRYKKENKKFDPIYVEKIMEVSFLNQYGVEVFGSKENFHSWLNSKNLALGGIIPKSLLDNTFGIQIVKEELTRIEHGVFA